MSDIVARLNATLEGRYEVVRELGRGGMATVYLARDVKHERDVALKVLKPELAAAVGAERFLAEIKTTAALQHPNILPLFDSAEADGLLFYVMPYVRGESLRSRLDSEKQLPVDEALTIARGVLQALGHAHRAGVVHRDIKPGNILIQDGQALVADFGIALAVSAGGERLTETGLSLGTPEYMSPEQVTGSQTIGPAADLWAVGCMLYEMLAGESPHAGGTPQAVLGRVLSTEADPVTERRRTTPQNVSDAIAASLEKIPSDRFTSAEAFASALDDAAFRRRPAAAGAGRRSLGLGALAAAFFAGAVAWAAISGVMGDSATSTDAASVRFKIDGHYDNPQGRVVSISPDGSRIVHSTRDYQLEVRSLDRSDVETELDTYGVQPFFSPDGEWIGFFGGGGSALQRIPVSGGVPTLLVAMDARPLGGHWTRDGVIVYASTEGLFSVPVDGGEPELLAAPDPEAGELYYAWPQVLPGSGDILFTLLPLGADTDDEGVIAVLDPETGEHTVVLRGGAGAMYRSERIFFTRNSELHALAFDPATATARGDEVPLTIEGIAVSRGLGPSFDLSGDGTLVYVPSAAPPNRELVWVDAAGQEEPLGAPALRYVYPRISHDGTRIVVDVSGDNRDLYVWDVARRSLSRLTEHPAEDFFGAWGPNGQVVYFTSNRSGAFNVYSRRADGTGTVQPVLESDGTQMLNGLTPDGRQLLVSQRQGALDFDLATIPMVGATTADVILATNNNESMAAVSPDGRWVAYQSDVSGEFEVYVGPFPEADQRRWKVSIDGGLHPHWSEDGSQLFYRVPSGDIVGASVTLGPGFEVGSTRQLVPHIDGLFSARAGGRRHDRSPIDGRFLVTKPVVEERGNGIIVVLNWMSGLESRVPTG